MATEIVDSGVKVMKIAQLVTGELNQRHTIHSGVSEYEPLSHEIKFCRPDAIKLCYD